MYDRNAPASNEAGAFFNQSGYAKGRLFAGKPPLFLIAEIYFIKARNAL